MADSKPQPPEIGVPEIRAPEIGVPEISVVVPVSGSENHLIACVDSILAQTFRDFEVVLSDRGERGVCHAVMLRFAEKDDRVRIVHLPSEGWGGSCNRGLEAARGRWIAIVDGDDLIEPTMLAELHEAAVRQRADVVRIPYSLYTEKTATRGALREDCRHRAAMAAAAPREAFAIDACPVLLGHHPSIWAGLYRAEFLRENGIRLLEAKGFGQVDQPFRFLTLTAAERLVWLDRCLYGRREARTSASASASAPAEGSDPSAAIAAWTVIHDRLRTLAEPRRSRLLAALLPEEVHGLFARAAGRQSPAAQIAAVRAFAAEHLAAGGVPAPHLALLKSLEAPSAAPSAGTTVRRSRLRRLWTDLSRLFHCHASIRETGIFVLLLTHSRKQVLSFRVELGGGFTILLAIGRPVERG